VTASEGVSGVDVMIAGDTESGGVSFAGDMSRSLLADFAK
jgi:hypothetical protein